MVVVVMVLVVVVRMLLLLMLLLLVLLLVLLLLLLVDHARGAALGREGLLLTSGRGRDHGRRREVGEVGRDDGRRPRRDDGRAAEARRGGHRLGRLLVGRGGRRRRRRRGRGRGCLQHPPRDLRIPVRPGNQRV